MNWSKYSLDDWLIQFGAWCESCRMRTGNYPDNLAENIINKLMIESGYKAMPSHKNTVELKISDDEALQVNDLILSVFERADGEIKQAIRYLFDYRVKGCSLRNMSKFYGVSTIDIRLKIHGAKCFIKGCYGWFNT